MKDSDLQTAAIRVPRDLWKRVGHAATEAEMSIQEYVTKLLEEKVPKFVVKGGKSNGRSAK